jgi:hypothetical protein
MISTPLTMGPGFPFRATQIPQSLYAKPPTNDSSFHELVVPPS